jgi:H+-transporting ATPase
MGSAIKRGETRCVVVATGKNTFFGKAAEMINQVVHIGRFQKILNKITLILLVLCTIFSVGIFIKLVVQQGWGQIMQILSVVVVIFVASIPVAIEVVCTSTLAVGSRRLAQKKVIVARLSAIEELAGMTILCSDKTGTLTLNKLSLREPIMLKKDMNQQEIVFYAALASKREEGNQDAIDLCITQAVPQDQRARLKAFVELDFVPFNPTDKRTESTLRAPDGSVFKVTKGAPQVVLRMCHNREEIKETVESSVQELADRGFRALGVAICYSKPEETPVWQYLGILSLFDPPRHDTKDTIAAAIANGVEVKMVTGDQTAIAKETCRELGMGTNILNTEVLNDTRLAEAQLDKIILDAHGFAEVMPEHKFRIVDRLRQQGHVTGMTGDGVNDAPALKRADIGIAVQGATDAARAAADIVLTQEGLSVIIDAIFRSRKIFQRMRNYCIYRISCTLQLLFFFFFAIVAFEPNSFYGSPASNSVDSPNPDTYYNDPSTLLNCSNGNMDECPYLWHRAAFTLPVLSMVIITVLNDGTMITIAHDKVIPEKRPQRWAMFEVTIISLVLSLVACLSSLILLLVLLYYNFRNPGNFAGSVWGTHSFNGGGKFIIFQEAQVIIYLKISLSDFLTLFSGRTRTWFWERRPGYALAAASLFATGTSTLFSVVWGKMFAGVPDARMAGLLESKTACIGTWIYCIIWFFVQDAAKVLAYYVLSKLTAQDEQRAQEVKNKSLISAMIDDDRRLARRAGGLGREVSFATEVNTLVSTQTSQLESRVHTLEAEILQLKTAIKTMAH